MGRIEIYGRLCGSILAAIVFVGSIVLPGFEAEAESATSTVSAEVVTASGISSAAGPGKLTNDGGTVGIATGGAASPTGDVVANSHTGDQAATFDLTGGANAAYTISLPPRISVSDGLDTMTVDLFVDGVSGTGTLDSTGNGSFTVGATLTAAMIQATGAYSGTFSVTVEHQ